MCLSATGDSLVYHTGQYFSTVDRDNDNYNASCAQLYSGGGWWYNYCYKANLNGQYGNDMNGDGIVWITWHADSQSLPFAEMKIKPM